MRVISQTAGSVFSRHGHVQNAMIVIAFVLLPCQWVLARLISTVASSTIRVQEGFCTRREIFVIIAQ
jgi:hypothetical protein